MIGEPGVGGAGQVSTAVSGWLVDVGKLLQCVQLVVENATPARDAPPEVGMLLPQLPAMIRQCRAQVPTGDMVAVWVRSLAAESRHAPPHRDAHGGDPPKRHGGARSSMPSESAVRQKRPRKVKATAVAGF